MWHTGPLLAWDLETSGVDPETARIVTATVVWINGRQIESREWLVNPGIEIPAEASAIHGVTTEKARAEGIDPATACAQIWAELVDGWHGGRPVIGYNLSYDFTVLDRELRRHNGTHIDDVLGPVIDGFVIDKALDPYRKGSRKLTDVCAHYNVQLTDAHTSRGDALAAARLAWRLAQVYSGELADLTLVNEKQTNWRANWAANFADYLRQQGKPEVVDGNWPLRPFIGVPA